MKSIGVYCGSSAGENPVYAAAAKTVGTLLAQKKITLVYGGGNVGLMGCIADAALQHQGKVIGIIPKFLQEREVAHGSLDELIVYETMHERKLRMFELSEGFLALPGGFGTMDELFEILTWGQLSIHQHPIALLNVNGYYDHFLSLLDQMVQEKFVSPNNRVMLIVDTDPATILDKMQKYQMAQTEK
ncbi:MAG: TIGR00730 family Rossman fold protein [Saprospiraceae bacterium]